MDVFDELGRIVAPFDIAILADALDGKPTRFDVDGSWHAHHHGRPRCIGKLDAFDGDALVAGMQAVCWLGTHLPAGDPRRRAVPMLYRKLVARLANPELLIYGGTPTRKQLLGPPHTSYDWRGNAQQEGVDLGAFVDAENYVYFRPARMTELTAEQREILVAGASLSYPTSTFPWSGLYHVWTLVDAPGVKAIVARAAETPLPDGAYELDPRRSAPAIVQRVADRHALDDDAAALYLQLLALADCGDVWLREVNGWKKPAHDKAGARLVEAGLVAQGKQPRANRKLALPGTWEKLFPPHPAIERAKLELYGARMDGKGLAAPLGRVLPLRPIHELFAEAWQRACSAAGEQRVVVAEARDWNAELRAAPHDDQLRLVYADWLTEQGDPRGELVALQVRRAQLARADVIDGAHLAQLRAAEQALIAKHGGRWSEAFHPFVESYAVDRGCITSLTVRAPMFAKHARAIVEAVPLLEELVLFTTGGIGPIPAKHVEALVACPQLARISRLDFTPDHYLSSIDELRLLLDGEYLPRLRYLRLGYHRPGDGFGSTGAGAIADCTRLSELVFLEVPGNSLGLAGVTALLESPHLTRLEVLRVPYNGLRAADAVALARSLEAGALPALRVLDLSNVLATTEITKACSFYRNRIPLEHQQTILHILAARRGEAEPYRDDATPKPGARGAGAQGNFTGRMLEQTGHFPFAARAKSGTSKCVVCGNKIAMGALRIGIERELDAVGKVTSWLHPACRATCPELAAIADLEDRLTENSSGLWPEPD